MTKREMTKRSKQRKNARVRKPPPIVELVDGIFVHPIKGRCLSVRAIEAKKDEQQKRYYPIHRNDLAFLRDGKLRRGKERPNFTVDSIRVRVRYQQWIVSQDLYVETSLEKVRDALLNPDCISCAEAVAMFANTDSAGDDATPSGASVSRWCNHWCPPLSEKKPTKLKSYPKLFGPKRRPSRKAIQYLVNLARDNERLYIARTDAANVKQTSEYFLKQLEADGILTLKSIWFLRQWNKEAGAVWKKVHAYERAELDPVVIPKQAATWKQKDPQEWAFLGELEVLKGVKAARAVKVAASKGRVDTREAIHPHSKQTCSQYRLKAIKEGQKGVEEFLAYLADFKAGTVKTGRNSPRVAVNGKWAPPSIAARLLGVTRSALTNLHKTGQLETAEFRTKPRVQNPIKKSSIKTFMGYHVDDCRDAEIRTKLGLPAIDNGGTQAQSPSTNRAAPSAEEGVPHQRMDSTELRELYQLPRVVCLQRLEEARKVNPACCIALEERQGQRGAKKLWWRDLVHEALVKPYRPRGRKMM